MSHSGHQALGPSFQAEKAPAGANRPTYLGSWVGPSRRGWAHCCHLHPPYSSIARSWASRSTLEKKRVESDSTTLGFPYFYLH